MIDVGNMEKTSTVMPLANASSGEESDAETNFTSFLIVAFRRF